MRGTTTAATRIGDELKLGNAVLATDGRLADHRGGSSVEQATKTLLDTWQQGRKVLVVLGAGASVAAKIPLMSSVYADLLSRLDSAELGDEFLVSELRRNLGALERGTGSRSLAAMALGTLQKAHEKTKDPNDLHAQLASIWNGFSEDFIAGRIGTGGHGSTGPKLSPHDKQIAADTIRTHPFASALERVLKGASPEVSTAEESRPLHRRNPTRLHYLVARWVAEGWATVVSVNFDGLTRKALGRVLREPAKRGSQPAAVVLSEPKALRNFIYGSGVGDPTSAVIKVWGDVFHAVCTNSRCPEAGVRVPIFRLAVRTRHGPGGTSQPDKPEHQCPSCFQRRQLQIFFTGYQEKEMLTHELMEEMLRTVAPQIGCVLMIGFSGLWDHALVRFVAILSGLIARENKATAPDRAACICVDPHEIPALMHDLESQGVSPCHVRGIADEFADLFAIAPNSVATPESLDLPRFGRHSDMLADGLWHRGQGTDVVAATLANALPITYEHLRTGGYLAQAERLRQLGVKTKISIAMQGLQRVRVHEEDHNRRMHSRGAAHLAALWFRALSEPLQLPANVREQLCAITVFSALHHDLGHLPFTHLTEEIFDELHWSLDDWELPFRHDEPVLADPFEDYRDDLKEAIDKTATQLQLSSGNFRHWAECAIQGRSGYPWVDAILNSALDVDKIDYVFRDCLFLDQQLHISQENASVWVSEFFSHSRVLPSGFVALEGVGGTHARDFLEERWWLYRRQYNRAGFRAIERVARAVIIQWLLWRVPSAIGADFENTTPRRLINDPSALKGKHARKLLWKRLTALENRTHGEPHLLRQMTREIGESTERGLAQSARVKEWALQCDRAFERIFENAPPSDASARQSLLEYLRSTVEMTCSDSSYIRYEDLPKVREIARHLETMRPFRAMIDLAVFPRMLAYPTRRRVGWGDSVVIGDCFAVSNKDPDRWGVSSSRWIPLSESAFAERDRKRWAKVMVVSPYPQDPEVWHMFDRLRNECRQRDIKLTDLDPDKLMQL
jgi:HD superfamily phosphohydrolase